MNQEAKENKYRDIMEEHDRAAKEARYAILRMRLSYVDKIKLIYISRNPIRKFYRLVSKTVFDR